VDGSLSICNDAPPEGATVSKKTAPTKKAAAKKNVVAKKKAAPPKKKVVAKKVVAPKKKTVAKKVAAPKKVAAAAKKPAPPPVKVVAKKAAPPKKAAAPPAGPSPVKVHAWRDVSVELDGDVQKVIFFDWQALSDAKRDPSPTAKHHPNRNPFVWVEQFDEYIVGHWLDPVGEGDWEPIAVVGLGHASTTESFAEMNNRGFLAVVKGGGSYPEGTVLWLDGPRYDKDEPFIVAPHVGELKIIRR
jgi:hypothetical protein